MKFDLGIIEEILQVEGNIVSASVKSVEFGNLEKEHDLILVEFIALLGGQRKTIHLSVYNYYLSKSRSRKIDLIIENEKDI